MCQFPQTCLRPQRWIRPGCCSHAFRPLPPSGTDAGSPARPHRPPHGPVRLCSGELVQVRPALMPALGEAAGQEGPRAPWRHGAGSAPGSASAQSLVLAPCSFPGRGLHLAPALLPEVTGTSQGNPGFPAATLERPRPSKSLHFSGPQFHHLDRRETMIVLTPRVHERIKCRAVPRPGCFLCFNSSHAHSLP